jgi:hypothetical protein
VQTINKKYVKMKTPKKKKIKTPGKKSKTNCIELNCLSSGGVSDPDLASLESRIPTDSGIDKPGEPLPGYSTLDRNPAAARKNLYPDLKSADLDLKSADLDLKSADQDWKSADQDLISISSMEEKKLYPYSKFADFDSSSSTDSGTSPKSLLKPSAPSDSSISKKQNALKSSPISSSSDSKKSSTDSSTSPKSLLDFPSPSAPTVSGSESSPNSDSSTSIKSSIALNSPPISSSSDSNKSSDSESQKGLNGFQSLSGSESSSNSDSSTSKKSFALKSDSDLNKSLESQKGSDSETSVEPDSDSSISKKSFDLKSSPISSSSDSKKAHNSKSKKGSEIGVLILDSETLDHDDRYGTAFLRKRALSTSSFRKSKFYMTSETKSKNSMTPLKPKINPALVLKSPSAAPHDYSNKNLPWVHQKTSSSEKIEFESSEKSRSSKISEPTISKTPIILPAPITWKEWKANNKFRWFTNKNNGKRLVLKDPQLPISASNFPIYERNMNIYLANAKDWRSQVYQVAYSDMESEDFEEPAESDFEKQHPIMLRLGWDLKKRNWIRQFHMDNWGKRLLSKKSVNMSLVLITGKSFTGKFANFFFTVTGKNVTGYR